MLSLFQMEKNSVANIVSPAGLSTAIHALLLVLIVASSIRVRHAVIFRPMIQGSSQQIAVVAVGRGALAAVLASEHPAVPEKTQAQARRENVSHRVSPGPPKAIHRTPTPPQAEQLSAGLSGGRINAGVSGQGSDAQSMYPAYPVVSPSPQVRDRSLLPQTSRKIVVDVNLSADGQIQQTSLVSGMSNALDQLVLDTVRSWQFHPAMLNGRPVPSTMELVFPFDKNYPDAE
jgi:TonB family protein